MEALLAFSSSSDELLDDDELVLSDSENIFGDFFTFAFADFKPAEEVLFYINFVFNYDFSFT